jgi:hypothetical protein
MSGVEHRPDSPEPHKPMPSAGEVPAGTIVTPR